MSTEIVDAVDGIEAKGVDVIFGEPVKSVINDPAADAVTLGPVEVNGLAPGSEMGIGEAGSELREVIPLRAKMVVDHVHDDGEAVVMAGIHQFLQAGGTAVGILRRVEAGAVVSPIAIPGKFGDRHDFDGGNAEVAKIGEMRNCAFKRALRGERTGMEFIDDEVFERDSGPALV